MKMPWYQSVLLQIGIIVAILIPTGGFLRVIDVRISCIPPSYTYIGTILALVIWGTMKFIPKRWPIPWAISGGYLARFRKIKFLNSLLFTALILLWYPRLTSSFLLPIELPELDALIFQRAAPYAPGLEVSGIKWKSDFGEYVLKIWNKSKATDISNLRIEMEVPGGVITHHIISQSGAKDLSFSRTGFDIIGPTNIQGLIIQNTKFYTSSLLLTSTHFLQDGFIEIKLVIEVISDWPQPGFLRVKYYYINPNCGQTTHTNKTYQITIKDINKKSLFIDTTNPLTDTIMPSYGIVLDEPHNLGGIQIRALFLQNAETAKALGLTPF